MILSKIGRGEVADQHMSLVEKIKKWAPVLLFSASITNLSLPTSSQEFLSPLEQRAQPSLEQELLSLKNKKGEAVFDVESANHYVQLDQDFGLAIKLAEVKDKKGRALLQDGNEIVPFLRAGGTLSDLKTFAQVVTPKGYAVFSWWQMAELLQSHIPFARIQDTVHVLNALNQAKDKPHFNSYDQWNFLMRGGTPSIALQLASVVDPLDPTRSFFLDGNEEDQYLSAGGKAEEAKAWATLKDKNQHFIFRRGDGNLITWALQDHHDLPYFKQLANEGHDAYVIRQFIRGNLDLDAGCFVDTEKPNALLLYAEKDNIPSVFDTQWDAQFILRLEDDYDVLVRTVAAPAEICEMISEVSDLELLTINVHSIRTTLFLSTYDRGQKEKIISFFSDLTCLQKLHPEAVIFLRACSAGKGGAYAFNIANRIAEQAPGRTVISSQGTLSSDQIHILSYRPFSALLMKTEKQDMSYVARR